MLYLGCEGEGGVHGSSSRTLLLDAQSSIDCLNAVELSQTLPLTLRNGGHAMILQDIHRRGDVVHKVRRFDHRFLGWPADRTRSFDRGKSNKPEAVRRA